jgi:hypothetical protein
MKEKKITASDLRHQAEQLIASGKMPSMEQLLQAVTETRKKYVPLIIEARGSRN